MEIFFSNNISGTLCYLTDEESAHGVRVLGHREGDEIFVIDGEGTLYTCRLTDANPKSAQAQIVKEEPDWGAHPYYLQMAVCPTKNIDRYEWFAEKATEVGLDEIVPVIGEHSERKVFKTDRLKRILLSASKQSLKGAVPKVSESEPLKDFINRVADEDAVKLIAICFEGDSPRLSVAEALKGFNGGKIIILIGPEGDFSREEAALALQKGFRPIHLGPSRLRTETAATVAATAVYLELCTSA
ncbi:MAG: 16S rRNA (uracil(1498)-N(3))-methyltransferase [Bacteroidales bacterium]|nr:16S rRNA (uracil(1498)-N(3))-methyltransferase [Bacteroidales bacterium]